MDKYDRDRVFPELKDALSAAPATIWLVITEGWCGDAASNVPLLNAAEKEMTEKIKLRLVLRDSNTELMDANLTDAGRSNTQIDYIG
jgi:hypothetical protein